MEVPNSSQERPKRVPRAAKSCQERQRASQERSKSVPRASQERPRAPKSAQERAKRAKLAPKTPPRRGLGRLLGGSWEYLGDIWRLFGSYVGARRAYSKRLIEILKNLEKHCKVLQKSRFGRTSINRKSSKICSKSSQDHLKLLFGALLERFWTNKSVQERPKSVPKESQERTRAFQERPRAQKVDSIVLRGL